VKNSLTAEGAENGEKSKEIEKNSLTAERAESGEKSKRD
jgi:hypothetical protein